MDKKSWRKVLVGEWNWRRPIKSLAFIYVALALIAVLIPYKIMFRPPEPSYAESNDAFIALKTSEAERIACLYYPAKAGYPTLLWSHGNGEDIGLLEPILEYYHDNGLGVLAYDYPGYGLSTGSTTEESCYRAAEAAMLFLMEEKRISLDDILIYGQSVGSGPAIWLAEKYRTTGIILVSPIASAHRAAIRFPILPNDKFPNLSRIADIEIPLLVLHGDSDRIVNQRNGRQLYHAHPGSKGFVSLEDTGHNDIYDVSFHEVTEAVLEFCWKLRPDPTL